MIKYALVSAFGAIVGVLAFVVIQSVFLDREQPSIGVIDLKKIVKGHINTTTQDPAIEVEREANQFYQQLSYAIAQVSLDHNVVMVIKPAVVSTAPDYTAAVKEVLVSLDRQ